MPYTQVSLSDMPELNDYMTVQEAANRLGFHVNHIRRMRRQGDLEGIKIGSIWLISKKSVEDYRQATAGLNKFDPTRGNQ